MQSSSIRYALVLNDIPSKTSNLFSASLALLSWQLQELTCGLLNGRWKSMRPTPLRPRIARLSKDTTGTIVYRRCVFANGWNICAKLSNLTALWCPGRNPEMGSPPTRSASISSKFEL